jgi:serine/threonine-protein kinase
VPPLGAPRKRNPVPIILAAAGLVVILVVVLIVVLVTKNSGGGGDGQASGTTAAVTGSTSPSASPSTSPSTPPTTASSSAPPTATATGTAKDDLLAIIPGGFDRGRCRTADPAGDGDLAAIGCGASGVQPGPSDSAFYLYPDSSTADSVFLGDASGYSLTELPDGTNCPDAQGYQNYNDSSGNYAGRLACFVRSDDNASVLFWTQDQFSVEGYVTLKDGGTAGLTTLMDWWRQPSNSDFGG